MPLDSPFGLKSPFNQAPFHASGTTLDGYRAGGVVPTLILDFCAGFHGTRPLDETDYKAGGVAAKLVLDFNNDFFGSDT